MRRLNFDKMPKGAILGVVGTRPEAIKMSPLFVKMRKANLPLFICSTGQHRDMLEDAFSPFGIFPDLSLDIMKENQSLSYITSKILTDLSELIDNISPVALLVHGDTSTAFSAALAAFFKGVKVFHIEAGLRTGDLTNPLPEEFNRRAIALMAKHHFAPTVRARDSLLAEGVKECDVTVVGNTAIDALAYTVREDYSSELYDLAGGKRLIIVTAHRREVSEEELYSMLLGIRSAVERYEDVITIFPVHRSPRVRKSAENALCGCKKIILTDPLSPFDFHNLLSRAYLAVTDSGGIQEEAAYLGVPTLVIREKTERREAVEAGTVKVCGTHGAEIYMEIKKLLDSPLIRNEMAKPSDAYGGGDACEKILEKLHDLLKIY